LRRWETEIKDDFRKKSSQWLVAVTAEDELQTL